MIDYGKQLEKFEAESRAKTEPNAVSVKLGVDILTGALWDAAVERAQGAMQARKLQDEANGMYMNDPASAYRVKEQHVVRAYEGLVKQMDLPTKLLAHRGTFQPNVSMEELLGQGSKLDYASLINSEK